MSDEPDPEKYANEHGRFALKNAAEAFDEAANAANRVHVEGLSPAELDELRNLQRSLKEWTHRFDEILEINFEDSDEVSES